jgi:hypothetical protein
VLSEELIGLSTRSFDMRRPQAEDYRTPLGAHIAALACAA